MPSSHESDRVLTSSSLVVAIGTFHIYAQTNQFSLLTLLSSFWFTCTLYALYPTTIDRYVQYRTDVISFDNRYPSYLQFRRSPGSNFIPSLCDCLSVCLFAEESYLSRIDMAWFTSMPLNDADAFGWLSDQIGAGEVGGTMKLMKDCVVCSTRLTDSSLILIDFKNGKG